MFWQVHVLIIIGSSFNSHQNFYTYLMPFNIEFIRTLNIMDYYSHLICKLQLHWHSWHRPFLYSFVFFLLLLIRFTCLFSFSLLFFLSPLHHLTPSHYVTLLSCVLCLDGHEDPSCCPSVCQQGKKVIWLLWSDSQHLKITLISAYSQLLYKSAGHSLECHLKCIEGTYSLSLRICVIW